MTKEKILIAALIKHGIYFLYDPEKTRLGWCIDGDDHAFDAILEAMETYAKEKGKRYKKPKEMTAKNLEQ